MYIVLLWLHLLSLALGGAATFGIPVVGSRMATAGPEMRPALFGIVKLLSTIGRGALVVLLLTGPGMLAARGWAIPNSWFWVKMVLVLAMIGAVVYAGILSARAMKGDMDAARQQPMVGTAAMVIYVVLILSAVLAFN